MDLSNHNTTQHNTTLHCTTQYNTINSTDGHTDGSIRTPTQISCTISRQRALFYVYFTLVVVDALRTQLSNHYVVAANPTHILDVHSIRSIIIIKLSQINHTHTHTQIDAHLKQMMHIPLGRYVVGSTLNRWLGHLNLAFDPLIFLFFFSRSFFSNLFQGFSFSLSLPPPTILFVRYSDNNTGTNYYYYYYSTAINQCQTAQLDMIK